MARRNGRARRGRNRRGLVDSRWNRFGHSGDRSYLGHRLSRRSGPRRWLERIPRAQACDGRGFFAIAPCCRQGNTARGRAQVDRRWWRAWRRRSLSDRLVTCGVATRDCGHSWCDGPDQTDWLGVRPDQAGTGRRSARRLDAGHRVVGRQRLAGRQTAAGGPRGVDR